MISEEFMGNKKRKDEEELREEPKEIKDNTHDEEENKEEFYEDDYDTDEDYDENDEEDRRHLYRRKKGYSWEEENEADLAESSTLDIDIDEGE